MALGSILPEMDIAIIVQVAVRRQACLFCGGTAFDHYWSGDRDVRTGGVTLWFLSCAAWTVCLNILFRACPASIHESRKQSQLTDQTSGNDQDRQF